MVEDCEYDKSPLIAFRFSFLEYQYFEHFAFLARHCLYFSSFCLHFFLDRPLVGPFLEIPDRSHKFNVINDRVVPPREMKVPCYDVDINHHFQGLLENIEELKQLSGTYMTLKTENLDKLMYIFIFS